MHTHTTPHTPPHVPRGNLATTGQFRAHQPPPHPLTAELAQFADAVATAAPGHKVAITATSGTTALVTVAGHHFKYTHSPTTRTLVDLGEPDAQPHSWTGPLDGAALVSALWWARRNGAYAAATRHLHSHLEQRQVTTLWRPRVTHRDPSIGATVLDVDVENSGLSVVRIDWKHACAYLYCVPGDTKVAYIDEQRRKSTLLALIDRDDAARAEQVLTNSFDVAARLVDEQDPHWPR